MLNNNIPDYKDNVSSFKEKRDILQKKIINALSILCFFLFYFKK